MEAQNASITEWQVESLSAYEIVTVFIDGYKFEEAFSLLINGQDSSGVFNVSRRYKELNV